MTVNPILLIGWKFSKSGEAVFKIKFPFQETLETDSGQGKRYLK